LGQAGPHRSHERDVDIDFDACAGGPAFHPDGRVEIGVPQDPNSPIVIAAANACRSKLPGSDAGNFFSKLLHRGR
jgi:hypothetical protein